jgi:hypothetical protein
MFIWEISAKVSKNDADLIVPGLIGIKNDYNSGIHDSSFLLELEQLEELCDKTTMAGSI